MSVGGIVVNVIDSEDKIWVNTREREYSGDEGTAIYIKKPDIENFKIRIGDSLWWQGGIAFWTVRGAQESKDIEIKLERLGYSHGEYDDCAPKQHLAGFRKKIDNLNSACKGLLDYVEMKENGSSFLAGYHRANAIKNAIRCTY